MASKYKRSLSNNYTIKELKVALANYKPRPTVTGIKNGMFNGGIGEKYVRIRIKGIKIRRSHMVWRVNHSKIIPFGFEIHHLNEDKRDDRIENLCLIDIAEHAKRNLTQYQEKPKEKPKETSYSTRRVKPRYGQVLWRFVRQVMARITKCL